MAKYPLHKFKYYSKYNNIVNILFIDFRVLLKLQLTHGIEELEFLFQNFILKETMEDR